MIGNNFLDIIVLKHEQEDIHGPWNGPCEADRNTIIMNDTCSCKSNKSSTYHTCSKLTTAETVLKLQELSPSFGLASHFLERFCQDDLHLTISEAIFSHDVQFHDYHCKMLLF